MNGAPVGLSRPVSSTLSDQVLGFPRLQDQETWGTLDL